MSTGLDSEGRGSTAGRKIPPWLAGAQRQHLLVGGAVGVRWSPQVANRSGAILGAPCHAVLALRCQDGS